MDLGIRFIILVLWDLGKLFSIFVFWFFIFKTGSYFGIGLWGCRGRLVERLIYRKYLAFLLLCVYFLDFNLFLGFNLFSYRIKGLD